MKESWLYYDFLRRWLWLLLVGAMLGALAGLAYYSSQVHPVDYAATATVVITDPTWEGEDAPTMLVSISTVSWPTEKAATASVESSVATMAKYANIPAVIRDVTIAQNGLGAPWWKPVILGTVVSILLTIGAIYTWEDARAYQRHRQQVGPTNT
jgi:uncharacterized membrane protein YpjA